LASARALDNIIGKQYGRLTVLSRGPKNARGRIRWECQCLCGNIVFVDGTCLRAGMSQSCGCLQKELARERVQTHGRTKTPEYQVWAKMKQRCLNPTDPGFQYYGARGIELHWSSFEAFFADMGPRPGPDSTIERLSNNGPYSKDNCAWASWERQANNKRTTRWVLYEGERMSLADAARKSGVPYNNLSYQINHGRPSIVIPLPRVPEEC
jgi:hypothetical protein